MLPRRPPVNADDATCDVCDEPAVIQYADPTTESEHNFCNKHRRNPEVERKAVDWLVRRRRYLPLENNLSEKLALPAGSQKHQDFRWEMCEARLIGGDGAVRYYFSIISGRDQFIAWEDQFAHDVSEFVVARTSKAAGQFIDSDISPHWVCCLTDFFRRAWEQHQGIETKITKRAKAVELLLTHPDWTDEQIAKSVPTTIGQLQRNSDYTGLRAVPIRRANANGT